MVKPHWNGHISHPVHGMTRRPGREVNSLEDEIQTRQAPEGACKLVLKN
jgi:hypothetical protein